MTLAQILAAAPLGLWLAVMAGLVLHIGGGLFGIAAGYAAVSVEKGAHRHRLFGRAFVVAMLAMAGAAVVTAMLLVGARPIEATNIAAGTLAGYLVLTAYMTVRRPENTAGAFEAVAAAVALAVAATYLLWGAKAAMAPTGRYIGFPAALYFAFGGLAGLSALLDIRTLRRGGLAGAARISRHLWRMCGAFALAAASFFIGQQKVMPTWLHGSPVLAVLGLAPLGLLAFWMIRVRIGNRFKRAAAAA